MLLVAISILAYPVLKLRQVSTIAYKESNLSINEEKIKELDQDLAEGRIEQASYEAAQEELDRELLIDIPGDTGDAASTATSGTLKKQPALVIMLAIFIPVMSILLYLQLGMPSATDADFVASQQYQHPHQQDSQQQASASIDDLTVQLKARIEKDGGTVQDWTMLARAHKFMGENELAEKAFTVALQHDENNVQLMLELADMIALNNNRLFNAQSRELLHKAYALEPNNANVLWFVGNAEYQAGNFKLAIDHSLVLLPIAREDENLMKSIVAMISRSRQQLIAAGEDMPELETMLGLTTTAEAAETGMRKTVATADKSTLVASAAATGLISASLNVTVNVSDEVRKKFKANDVVFVYAKAKQGPRMPLAAQRMTLAELPATVVLDDSMAMVEGMNISAFEQLVISARVSKSGSALAQSGDYIGSRDFKNNKTKASINVVIDTAVP
jgi:cytochrome c-type biogenesis protein CcmH